MSHTPGPWHVAEDGTWIEVCDEHGGVIVRFRCLHSIENARLMAAAPDSHEANVAMIKALNEGYGILPGNDDTFIYDALPSSAIANAYFMARDAIKKATQS